MGGREGGREGGGDGGEGGGEEGSEERGEGGDAGGEACTFLDGSFGGEVIPAGGGAAPESAGDSVSNTSQDESAFSFRVALDGTLVFLRGLSRV